jgi:hypothetical protein
MDALRSFLDWFEGFSDNIGEAPNAEQWGKVKARIARLGDDVRAVAGEALERNGAAVATSAAPAASAKAIEVPAAAKPQSGMTLAELYLVDDKEAKRQWRKRFEDELRRLDGTVTAQNAREISDTAGIQWDLTPEQQARAEVESWKI